MASLQADVHAVGSIRLAGAPRTLLLDTWSLFSAEGILPPSLARKLDVMLRDEGMRLAVLAEDPVAVRDALPAHSAVTVAATVDALDLHGSTISVLTTRPPFRRMSMPGTSAPISSARPTIPPASPD